MSRTRRIEHARRALGAAAILIQLAVAGRAQLTERESVDSNEMQASDQSVRPSVSLNGRLVAFESDATNLAAVDNNSSPDVFVRDRVLGTTTLLSEKAGSPGTTASGFSSVPRISSDGRYVIFIGPTDLSSPPATFGNGLWRKDLATGAIGLASLRSNGSQANGVQFLHADYDLSANGRYVVFCSGDSTIVGGDTNNHFDVFVRDFVAGTTTRVSTDSSNLQIPLTFDCQLASISGNGRWVLFVAGAATTAPPTTGVPHLLLKDTQTGTLTVVDVTGGGQLGNGGTPQWPRISGDGRFAVFQNASSNLYTDPGNPVGNSILLKDLVTKVYEPIAVDNLGVSANNSCYFPNITDDGRSVVFYTSASNLGAPGTDTKIVLRDRVTHSTSIVSRNTAGVLANDSSTNAAISGDGRFVVFQSIATNLDGLDTNNADDVFLRDRAGTNVFEYCVAQVNSLGCTPHASATGTPSASAGSGFVIKCVQVRNQRAGLLFYSSQGTQTMLFLGGHLCVNGPKRLLPQNSGGSLPPTNDCSGVLSYDFNAYVASGIDPSLVNGAVVATQFWSRDAAAPSGTNLSDAVLFTLFP